MIVAPGNEAQLGLDPKDAVVHSKEENDIGAEVLELANTHDPERLVLFLHAHGARSGALCYKSQNSCSLNAQKFVNMIKELDSANKQKEPFKQLKQILIAPISCYNKALATDIFNTLKQGADTSFSLAMTHMIQVNPAKCGSVGISVGEALFERKIKVQEYNSGQFKVWVNTADRLNKILTLKNLADFVSFTNDAMINNANTGARQNEEVSVFPAAITAKDFSLAQFELKPVISVGILSGDAPANQNVVNNQFTASPKEVVSGYLMVPEVEALVSSVIDTGLNKTYQANTPEYIVPIVWNSPVILSIKIAIP